MKKTLMISLIICILAIGTVGYAFATGLGFNSGIGALSTGTSYVTDVNVDQIYWGLESNADQAMSVNPYVNSVRLSFDQNLVQGTFIGVTLYDGSGNHLCHFSGQVNEFINSDGTRSFPLNTSVNPSDVYSIRVTVGEPRPFK